MGVVPDAEFDSDLRAVPAGSDGRATAGCFDRLLHPERRRAGQRGRNLRCHFEVGLLLIMPERAFNVLFLCTGNSARSVMAEALTTTLSNGRIRAFSAGSHPTGRVNPLAVELIRTMGYAVEALRSKSWDEFAGPDAPQMDFIVTVCDNAAGETCPIWPGRPISAHWGLEDPAAAQGSDEDRRRVFERIFQEIRARVRQVVSLPLDGMDRAAIKRELIGIGDGASSGLAT